MSQWPNEGTDTTCFPLFVKAATGDLGPKTNTNLSFNADTDTLSCLGFSGNFVGDLTGDVTGNADTATVLETARTIGGVSFNGSANILTWLNTGESSLTNFKNKKKLKIWFKLTDEQFTTVEDNLNIYGHTSTGRSQLLKIVAEPNWWRQPILID